MRLHRANVNRLDLYHCINFPHMRKFSLLAVIAQLAQHDLIPPIQPSGHPRAHCGALHGHPAELLHLRIVARCRLARLLCYALHHTAPRYAMADCYALCCMCVLHHTAVCVTVQHSDSDTT